MRHLPNVWCALSIPPAMQELAAVGRRGERLELFHFDGTRPVARHDLAQHDIGSSQRTSVGRGERLDGEVLSLHKKGSLITEMLIPATLPIGPMVVLILWGDKTGETADLQRAEGF